MERSPGWKKALQRADVQILLATGAFLFIGYKTSVFVLLFVLPLYAALIARPVITLLGDSRHAMRHAVWNEAQGQYYAFRDQRVLVVEDEFHCRWLRAADVRHIYPPLVNDLQLRRAYPQTTRYLGEKPAQLYVRDDTLVAHLRRVNDALSLRLGTWVDRSVWYPASQVRKRLNIRLEDEAGS